MNTTYKTIQHRVAQTLFVCLAFSQFAQAASTDIGNVPMAVNNAVTPNLLVSYDNSESMDAFMSGNLIDGRDANTRGNIGRTVMRDAITGYSTVFNWGLMSYGLTGTLQRYLTSAYYLGSNTGMVFTDDCTGYAAGAISGPPLTWAGGINSYYPPTPGHSATNGNRTCIANPQPFTGGNYVTFDQSGDDANIQDALYDLAQHTWWGLTSSGSSYTLYTTHKTASGTSWAASAFTGSLGVATFTETDAGFLPSNPPTTRQLYIPRAWGFLSSITGSGTLNESVQAYSVTHQDNLKALLANESDSTTSTDLKNAALFTPLKGTLDSAKTYFSTSYQSKASPIQYKCQQNFVMMVTDGMPTGNTSGNLYSTADRANSCTTTTAGNCTRNVASAKWTYPCTTATTGNCTRDVSTATWNYGTGTATATWPDTPSPTSATWTFNTTATATWPDTPSPTSATWTFSTAAKDAINSVAALRTTPNTVKAASCNLTNATTRIATCYDIQSYIVALGSTVDNPVAMAVMNAMAQAGGTDNALLATDADSFLAAITSITDNIISKTGSASATSVATAQVSSTNDASYSSSYNSGTWSGDLDAFAIDLNNGLSGNTSMWTAGSAQSQLDSRTSTDRYIATATDTAGAIGGVQFQPTTAATATKLSASQQALLNSTNTPPGPADSATVLQYLRGNTSLDGTTYRLRAHLLGDIVDAEPLVVGPPNAVYTDTGYLGTLTTFLELHANRPRMIYQSANDGMLHAFYANNSAGAANPCVSSLTIVCGGQEAWAYIPNLVMSTLNNLSSKTLFTHQYRVDGTPVARDVDFGNVNCAQPCTTNVTPEWHSLLVGGLGKGGRGYYALDVSNPVAASEADVAAMALWEFPHSVTATGVTQALAAGVAPAGETAAKVILNTGYSFGNPIIVKTKAAGWVVLVTSGYNNGTNVGDSGGDGLGHLFVLNPKTGDLIADLPTTGCTGTPTASPCGLAKISAYISSQKNFSTDFVYGGDLKGNVWRFDFSGSSVASWSVTRMAILKDTGGNPQPVTTAPELTNAANNTTPSKPYRLVLVGTGQYLGVTDISTTGTQSYYGLVDPYARPAGDSLYGTALPDPVRNTLVNQTTTTALPATTPATRNITTNPVNFALKNGWVVDLIGTGERANTASALVAGVLAFTTNIPSSVACSPGGSSWIYYLDYLTGGHIPDSTATWSAMKLGDALASRVVLVVLPNGKIMAEVHLSGDPGVSGNLSLGNNTFNLSGNNASVKLPITLPPPTGKRVSWRQLVQ